MEYKTWSNFKNLFIKPISNLKLKKMKSKLMISAGVFLFFLMSFITVDINRTIEKEDIVAIAGTTGGGGGTCNCYYTDGGEVERTRCSTCVDGKAYGTKTTCSC